MNPAVNFICKIAITDRELFFKEKLGDDSMKGLIDKNIAAAEACLLVSNLYSTSDKTKAVPNDNIKKIVNFVQLQMLRTIFPSYDWILAAENEKTESGLMILKTQILYLKLVEILEIFITLFGQYSFIDSIVFELLAVSVKSLFAHKIVAMQSICIKLITTVRQHCE